MSNPSDKYDPTQDEFKDLPEDRGTKDKELIESKKDFDDVIAGNKTYEEAFPDAKK